MRNAVVLTGYALTSSQAFARFGTRIPYRERHSTRWGPVLILACVADQISSSPWADDLFFAQAAAGRLALWLASERIYIGKLEIFGPIVLFIYGTLFYWLPRQHIFQKHRLRQAVELFGFRSGLPEFVHTLHTKNSTGGGTLLYRKQVG